MAFEILTSTVYSQQTVLVYIMNTTTHLYVALIKIKKHDKNKCVVLNVNVRMGDYKGVFTDSMFGEKG